MGMKLFGDDAGDISKIEINQDFARRFEHNKKREDLQRFEELKKKGVIDDSEEDDDSSDDDDDEIVNHSTKHDLKFFDVLIKVKNNDPSLKNNDAKLFDSDDEEDDENEGENGKKEKKKKTLFIKDVNAKHLIENGPDFDDENDEDEHKNKKKSYFEEQEEMRQKFIDAVADEDVDDGELLKVKNDKGDEDDDDDEDEQEYNKKLNAYFQKDDKLDENEKFLKDFFRKKMWIAKDDGNNKGLYDDEIDVSEDEKELEKQEEYEKGFNFRFEENAGDIIMGHSRNVEHSVRKKESKRKTQRENKKQRIAQAEFERIEEIKYLKNLKKKEMNEKLRKIRETAGIGENDGFRLEEHDLEEEFDPEEYDRKMKKAFDDEFYEAEDVDPGFGSDEDDGELKKPNFDEEDELLGLPNGWVDGNGSGDGFLVVREKNLKKKVNVNETNEEQLQDEEQKRKIIELEKELIKKELDEYLKLDCEGTIGDLRTRFKYKPVKENNYGLKAKEILIVDEKELNQLVPLKKLATYRDEFIVPHRKIKEHKQRIKSLLRGDSSDGLTNGSKRSKHDDQAETEKSKSDAETEKSTSDPKELSRKQRRKMRLSELKISEKRRMAYEGGTTKSNKKRKHKSKDTA